MSLKKFIVDIRNKGINLQEKINCVEDIKNAAQETSEQEKVDKNVGVYITAYGEKYHREHCRYLTHTKEEIELEKAKNFGYEPCVICKP